MANRRKFIKYTGAVGIAGLAGCTGGQNQSNAENTETSTESTQGTTAGESGNNGPLNVAAIMPSPTDDYGWSQAESQSIRNITGEMDGVELSQIVGTVAYTDTKSVVSDLAEKNDVVIADANGYLNTGTLEVSKNYPDTKFLTRNTAVPESLPENHVAYNQHLGMVWGPMAYAASLISESGKAGIIDSIPVLVRAHALRGAKCAVHQSPADMELMINWINSWFDPEKTRRNANSLIEKGADVIINGTNGATPGKVAQENDLFAVGYGIDMSEAAPDGYATSVLMQPEPIFEEGLTAARDSNWSDYYNRYPNHHPWAPKHYKGEGTIGLADWHDDVSDDVQTETEEFVKKADNYDYEYPEVWKENKCPDGTTFELDLPEN